MKTPPLRLIWAIALSFAALTTIPPTAHADELSDAVSQLQHAISSDKPDPKVLGHAGPEEVAMYESRLKAEIQYGLSQDGASQQFDQVIAHIQSAYHSDAVRQAVEKVQAAVKAKRDAQIKSDEADIDAKIENIKDVVRTAKKPEDLDALIGSSAPDFRGEGQYNNEALRQKYQQLRQMQQFVLRWQDYLFADGKGQSEQAASVLRDLINQNNVSIIPRSQLLAMSGSATLPHSIATQPSSATSASAPEAPGDGIRKIVEPLKQLDDIPKALDALSLLQKNPGFNFRPWNDPIAATMADLTAIYQAHVQHKAGLPVQFTMTTGTDTLASVTLPLKTQLLREALPDILGTSEPLHDGESIETYLSREMQAAQQAMDVALILRIQGLKAGLGEKDEEANEKEFAVTLNAALNQDQAGQYLLALISYQTALKNGGALAPAKEIGARIEAIKAAHPEDYQTAMKILLNALPASSPTSRPQSAAPIMRGPAPTSAPISIPAKTNGGPDRN